MFGICKTKHNSKDCNQCLFVASKIVWNIYFTFFLSVIDCTFYKGTIKSNCIILLCYVCVRSSHQERSATLLKKRISHRCFPVNFEKFLNTPFLTEHSGGCFWRSGVNIYSIVLELLARNRRNIWSLSEQ